MGNGCHAGFGSRRQDDSAVVALIAEAARHTGTSTPWDIMLAWSGETTAAAAADHISGLLDSVMTPGSGGGGRESAVHAAQAFYHFNRNHAQVTVPAPPFRGAYGGHRPNRRSNYRCAS
ncbi:unnamed protein product [Schistocephalus solidus]|uniref:ADP-ribosylglycohydrolase family protein n=1 Tax=Schistocephalus solidus TaxID=70667 RepID=A0A183SPT2_SCHSO|nr:unnamed protein product [Schistocephalus solidus]